MAFPMWKDETDEQYSNRVERLTAKAEHYSYIVLVHGHTFTKGLMGVEIYYPKLKDAFMCQAVDPEKVKATVAKGLQSLVDMGGPIPSMENMWMEVLGDDVIFGKAEVNEIFDVVHPRQTEEEPAPPVDAKPSVVSKEAQERIDSMMKRQAEDTKKREAAKKKEQAEFDAKKAKEEKKNAGLTQWFG